jgi:hypothetical protein
MSEFQKTTYNFNSRLVLNDDTTDPDAFVLVDPNALLDTLAANVQEPKPTEPGIIDYGVKFNQGIAVIPVQLVATSEAKMAQLIQDVKQAFNPDLLELDTTYGETTKYQGYHPLKWTETVGSTSRAFQIYLKSQETPIIEQDSLAGLVREGKLKLKAMDPRKYLQSQTTLTGAGDATNAGTYPTPVEITITASGTTSTSLQLINATRVPADAIYVTTALANNDVLVIDTFLHSVKLNGTEKRGMLGNNTEWWTLFPGQNTITYNNGTNMSMVTKFYSAWPL